MRSLRVSLVVLLVPIVIGVALAWLYVADPDAYLELISEDGDVEDLQVVLFGIAGVLGLVSAWYAFKSKATWLIVLLVVFALGCFVIAGEEVSWGQRFFGFEPPASVRDRNLQEEMTFHNLDGVQQLTAYGYYLIGAWVCLGWIFVRKEQLAPTDVRRFVVVDWPLITYFVPIALFYAWHDLFPPEGGYVLSEGVESWRHQESLELLFALGLTVLAFVNLRRARRLREPDPTPAASSAVD